MGRKQILLISKTFPPAIGGPATYGVRMAQELAGKGYDVTFVCATAAPNGFDDRYPFKVVRTGTRGNRLRREVGIRTVLLGAMLRAHLIYCMGLEHQTHWAARITRRRYVIRIGGDKVWEQARNAGVTCLEPASFYEETSLEERSPVNVEERRRTRQLRDAASIVYVSDYLKNLGRAWTNQRGGVEYVVPNGIEMSGPVTPERRRSDDDLRVIFVGRQTNWKGVDGVLLAIARVAGTRLTIAGSGPLWPANVDLCRRMGLTERTKFFGNVDNSQIHDHMRRHHVLILPSLYEGLSNTILEAGAAGLACIVSNRGGNPEVVEDGESGLLVDPFNIDQLSRAIAELRDDDGKRLRLAESLHHRVYRDFQLSETVQKTIHILETVCADNANYNLHFIAGRRRRGTISKRPGG